MYGQFTIQKYEQFQERVKTRQKIRISLDPEFQAQLDMMQYIVLSKFQKNARNLCKKKNNKQCDKVFKKSFKELADMQRIYYYILVISHLQNLINQDLTAPMKQSGSIKCQGYSKTYSKIGWKQVQLKIDFDKSYLYIQMENKLHAYDLNHYIMRKSKATDYYSLVLEAINQAVKEKRHQIHIGFKDVVLFREWYQGIRKLIQFMFWQKVKRMVFPSEVFVILQSKMQWTRSQRLINEQDGRLSQSSNLDKAVDGGEEDCMQKSASKDVFIEGLSQLSLDWKQSYHSVQIKSQSPRSSITSSQVDNQNLEDQFDQETFRSICRLGADDIEDYSDQSAVFHKLLLAYQFESIASLQSSHQQVYSSANQAFRLYSNTSNAKRIKAFIQVPTQNLKVTLQQFCILFCTPDFSKHLNDQIEQIYVKTVLTCDNCLIMYQKNKAYNRLYRARDFVFVRHQFMKNGRVYVTDKSIQEPSIPPFTTIVRGEMATVYQIYEEDYLIKINIDAFIENFGYLKDLQQLNINIKSFKGLQAITEKLNRLITTNTNIPPLLELKWPRKGESNDSGTKSEVQKQKQFNQTQMEKQYNQFSVENKLTTQKIEVVSSQVQSYKGQQLPIASKLEKDISQQNQGYRIAENIEQIAQTVEKMQFQGQISFVQDRKQRFPIRIRRKFDGQGKVIIDNTFIRRNQQTEPQPAQRKQFVYLGNLNGHHPIWRGNWQFPEQGGLKFINQKQIQQQKNVLKFILSQVAKNLISGRSILNISLPVDIFSSFSNLQRFVFSMSYAPCILQPATNMPPLERFLNTVVFGMSNSPLYLDMEKPFNSILGQTFQCFINGCPAYAQQISHHPPIAAIMLYGRGYRISAQIQSKMKLNINSGKGSNQGVYRVRYDDDEQICYVCPSGEVSGLAYGDRKFNIIGKAYAWSQKSGLFMQIVFDPLKKGFFGGKQQTPIDYFQGRVIRVKEAFLKTFIKNYSNLPKKTDIVEEFGKFSGNWNKKLNYEDRVLFSYDTYPLKLEYQQFPLPSDSNWREDITYRRNFQISSAQAWKQKLEIKQRNQRKLRQKFKASNK